MNRQLPAAAAAVIHAALTDADRAGIRTPAALTAIVTDALADAGWTCTPNRTPQTGTRAAA